MPFRHSYSCLLVYVCMLLYMYRGRKVMQTGLGLMRLDWKITQSPLLPSFLQREEKPSHCQHLN